MSAKNDFPQTIPGTKNADRDAFLKNNYRENNYERQLFVVQGLINQRHGKEPNGLDGIRNTYAYGYVINPLNNQPPEMAVLRLMDTKEYAKNLMQTRSKDTITTWVNRATGETAHYVREQGGDQTKLGSDEYRDQLKAAIAETRLKTIENDLNENVRQDMVGLGKRLNLPSVLNLDGTQMAKHRQEYIEVDGKKLPIVNAKWTNIATNTNESKIMNGVAQIVFSRNEKIPDDTSPKSGHHVPLHIAYKAKLVIYEPNPQVLSGNFKGKTPEEVSRLATDNFNFIASSLHNLSSESKIERKPHVFFNLCAPAAEQIKLESDTEKRRDKAVRNQQERVAIYPKLAESTRLAPVSEDNENPGTVKTYHKACSAEETLTDLLRMEDYYTKQFFRDPKNKGFEAKMLEADCARAVISALANAPVALAAPTNPKNKALSIYEKIQSGELEVHLFAGQQISLGKKSSADLVKKFIADTGPVAGLSLVNYKDMEALMAQAKKENWEKEFGQETINYKRNELKLNSLVGVSKGIIGYQPYQDNRGLYASYFEPSSLNMNQVRAESIQNNALTVDSLKSLYGSDKSGNALSFDYDVSDKALFDFEALPAKSALENAIDAFETEKRNLAAPPQPEQPSVTIEATSPTVSTNNAVSDPSDSLSVM